MVFLDPHTRELYADWPRKARDTVGRLRVAASAYPDDPKLASKYVRETLFKGQVTEADFDAAIGNAPYSYDITAEHLQVTGDTMAKYGVGERTDWATGPSWNGDSSK